MTVFRKSQLYSILSKWCHQMLFSRLPSCSTSSQLPNSSTSSPQNLKLPEDGNRSVNESPTVPEDCCNKDCVNCVWVEYVIKVAFHHKHNKVEIQKALNNIPDPEKRAFVEFDLKQFNKRNELEKKP